MRKLKPIGFNGIRTRKTRPSMPKPCEKISRLSLSINPRSTSPNFGVLMCSCAFDKPAVLWFIQWNLSRKGTIQRTWKGMNLGIGFSTSTKKQECWLSNCNPPTQRCFDFSWITNRSSCSTPLRPTRGHWIQFHGATRSSRKLTAWIQARSYIHSCTILRNLSPCLQI